MPGIQIGDLPILRAQKFKLNFIGANNYWIADLCSDHLKLIITELEQHLHHLGFMKAENVHDDLHQRVVF